MPVGDTEIPVAHKMLVDTRKHQLDDTSFNNRLFMTFLLNLSKFTCHIVGNKFKWPPELYFPQHPQKALPVKLNFGKFGNFGEHPQDCHSIIRGGQGTKSVEGILLF